VYRRVPGSARRVLRATKVPSLVILTGILGVPILFLILMTIVTLVSRSPLTFNALLFAIVQLQSPAVQGQASPQIVEMMHNMRPAQLALGRYAAESMVIDSFVVAVALFWWILKLFRFLPNAAQQA